jgi:hypothetical protein
MKNINNLRRYDFRKKLVKNFNRSENCFIIIWQLTDSLSLLKKKDQKEKLIKYYKKVLGQQQLRGLMNCAKNWEIAEFS